MNGLEGMNKEQRGWGNGTGLEGMNEERRGWGETGLEGTMEEWKGGGEVGPEENEGQASLRREERKL